MNTRLFVTVDNASTNLILQSQAAYTVELELFDDIEIPLVLQVADVRDISKKNSSHSLNFEIPATEVNKRILESTALSNYVDDTYNYEKMLLQRKYNCTIQQNSRDVFTGILSITGLNKSNGKIISYSCYCESRVTSFFNAISNRTFLGNEVWGDINNSQWDITAGGMTPAKFSKLYCYNSNTSTFELPEFSQHLGFAAIDRFYKAGQPLVYSNGTGYVDFRSYELTPYVYISDILDKIIRNAGYNWVSDFFGHTLDMLYPWDESRSWLTSRQSDVLQNIGKFNTFEMVMPSCKNMNGAPNQVAYIRHKSVSQYVSPGSRTDDDIDYIQKHYSNSYNGKTGVYTVADTSYFWDTSDASNNYTANPSALLDIHNRYSAQSQGWYRIKVNLNWKCAAVFRDNSGTLLPNTGIRYRLDSTIGDYEDGSYVAYDIRAQIVKVSGETTTILKEIYRNHNTGKSMCQYLTGFNRRLGRTGDNSQIVFASSEEYDEANSGKSDEEISNTSDYGLAYNRPIQGEYDIYLAAGDQICIRFVVGVRTGTDSTSFSPAYETYGDQNCRLYAVRTYIGQSYNNGDMFSVERLDTIGPTDGIKYNDILPGDMKQIDFLQSLCRMFNLYIEDVSLKPDYNSVNPTYPDSYGKYPRNTLRIEPRDVYYTHRYKSDDTTFTKMKKDWTDRIDVSTIEIKTPSDYINKNIKFNYKDDSSNDFMVKNYNDRYPVEKLGSYLYRSVYNSDELDTIDTSIAASEYGCIIPGKGSEVMFAFGANNGVVESNKTLIPRIMFRCLSNRNSGDVGLRTQIGNLVTLTGAYASLSNYKFTNSSRTSSVADLSFGLPKFSMMKADKNSNITTNNLFNAFYLNELSNIASENSRLMTCNAYLTAADIENLQLSDEIIIDSVVYHINKISDWKSEKEPCRCEFIKVLPDTVPKKKTEGVLTDYNYTIGVISQDSKGNTIINNNTVIVGGEGGGGSYTLTQNRENLYLMSGGSVVSTVTVPDMVGATSGASGKNGLVPQPTTTDRTKFLKGNGQWADTPSYTLDSVDGVSISLFRDGSLVDRVVIDEFMGADAYNIGAPGLVPTAQIADRTKFLRGDGTWAAGAGGNTYTLQNNSGDPTQFELLENGVVSSVANVPEYEGCTSQFSGEYGMLKPAAAGQMNYYFAGDGTWKPIPTGSGYVLRFSLHGGVYALDSGTYSGAVSALRNNIPVFAILRDEDVTQDGDEILYTLSHYYDDDSSILFSKKESSSTDDYIELYDDNSFSFYTTPIRNFGRLKVDSNSAYQSITPNSTLTLNSGTGVQLAQSNDTVTVNMKTASNAEIGGVKVSATQAPDTGTLASSGTRRPVQVDSNGNASVLVPDFSLNVATSQALGGIKVSATQAQQIGGVADQGTIRPVQVDSNGVAGVKIPDELSPLMLTTQGVTCKAADIEASNYREGISFLDYTSKNYKEMAGTVTPLIGLDTDEYGQNALKAWADINSCHVLTSGTFFAMAPKPGAEFYALPVVMMRTSDGSVPVVLINKDLAKFLVDGGEYIQNQSPFEVQV